MKDVLHANPEALKLAKQFSTLDAVTGDASKSHRAKRAKEKRKQRRSTMRKGAGDAAALAAQLQGFTVGDDFKLKQTKKRRGSKRKSKQPGQRRGSRLSQRRTSVADRLKEFQERQARLSTAKGPSAQAATAEADAFAAAAQVKPDTAATRSADSFARRAGEGRATAEADSFAAAANSS